MVGAWQASGVSMRAYAQHVRIHERWFSLWRRRRAPQERRRLPPTRMWLPLRLASNEALRMVTA